MVYDLIIIGAGPAGISAAIYAARQKLNFLFISKSIGGQIANKSVDIENYLGFEKISGPELIRVFEKQLRANNIEVDFDEVLKIQKQDNKFIVSTKLGKKHEALSVIVATGADPRPLEAEGEKKFIGKGVSYCPLCDGPMFKDKDVAVIGGGNAGFEAGIFLANYVRKIYVLEVGKETRADKENQDILLKSKKAEIITNAKVLKIEGSQFVESLSYLDVGENQEKKLDIQGVFIEIGNSPATAFVKDLVDFSEKDEIISDLETYVTKTPGLFAAGDCNKGKYKQIVAAAGEGAKAALAAYEYLQKIK